MTAERLFKKATPFLDIIESTIPEAATNEYRFISDEWFLNWLKSPDFSVERYNYIIASEMVEKAHLPSLSAILRAKRWAEATCLMYERQNFLGLAAAVNGGAKPGHGG